MTSTLTFKPRFVASWAFTASATPAGSGRPGTGASGTWSGYVRVRLNASVASKAAPAGALNSYQPGPSQAPSTMHGVMCDGTVVPAGKAAVTSAPRSSDP